MSEEDKKEHLDAILQDFLENELKERRKGHTIANIRLELNAFRVELDEHATARKLLEMRVDRHGTSIRELKRKLDMQDEIDTGQYHVLDLEKLVEQQQEKRDKERRDSLWWRRTKVQWAAWIVGVIITTLISAIGVLLWYVITHGK